MSLNIRCSKCSQILAVKPEQAGTKVSCPKCRTVLAVPAGITAVPTAVPLSKPGPIRAEPTASTASVAKPAPMPTPTNAPNPKAITPQPSAAKPGPAPMNLPGPRMSPRRLIPNSGSSRALLIAGVFVFLFAVAGGGTILVLNMTMGNDADSNAGKSNLKKNKGKLTAKNNTTPNQTETSSNNNTGSNGESQNNSNGNANKTPDTNPDLKTNENSNPNHKTDKNPETNEKPNPDPKSNENPDPNHKSNENSKKKENPGQNPKTKENPNTNPETNENPKTEPKEQKPPPTKKKGSRLMVLDDFGNPVDKTAGLGGKTRFNGNKILVWWPDVGEGRYVTRNDNPMWEALRKKGFEVQLESGRFQSEWLNQIDQLWLLSTRKGDNNSLAPHDYGAIEEFVQSGKGLYLLADNVPYVTEAQALGQRLFDTTFTGKYVAKQIAYVEGHNLSEGQIAKYGGQFPIKDHALLTGVNFLYEGITISHFEPTEKLKTIIKASHNKPLVGVSQVPGQRVVVDCGFTRYFYDDVNKSMNFITQTAGTLRFGENVAAYLMGKGKK